MYHYESHSTTSHTDGSQSSSSVVVRELDEGEVGILMAGNNSILDPSLTPNMLAGPTDDYDVESDTLSPSLGDDNDDFETEEEEDEEEEEEKWFPSLEHMSLIHGLDDDDDDDDDIMMDKMMESLFATAVVEKDDDDDDTQQTMGEESWKKKPRRQEHRQRQRHRHRQDSQQQHRPKKSRKTTISSNTTPWPSDRMDDDIMHSSTGTLVPLDVVYIMLND